jgi:hypothetical protein
MARIARVLVTALGLPVGCNPHHPSTTTSGMIAADRVDDEPESASGREGDDRLDRVDGPSPRAGCARGDLVVEVERELGRLTASSYSHATHVDEDAAVYDYDCSGFVVYALSRSVPDALEAVRTAAGRRPRSAEFVAFFEGILAGERRGRWQRIGRVGDLAAGDIIAWLKPAGSRSANTGHTMVVHGAPSPDPRRPGAFLVPVIDSTETPHGPNDSRFQSHVTGLGQGEIVLITDADGAPRGYRWANASKSPEKATTIAMGRVF